MITYMVVEILELGLGMKRLEDVIKIWELGFGFVSHGNMRLCNGRERCNGMSWCELEGATQTLGPLGSSH